MGVSSTAGTVLSVSIATPATQDKVGYDALTFTEVGEITDMGEIGPDGTVISYQSISSRLDKKLKGSVNAGNQSLSLGRDITDAGQIILKAAAEVGSATIDTDHSFKIEYKDGSIDYYQGLIMNYVTGLGSSNQVTTATTMIELNTSIVDGT